MFDFYADFMYIIGRCRMKHGGNVSILRKYFGSARAE